MRAAFEDDEMPLTEEDLKKSAERRGGKRSNGSGIIQYLHPASFGGIGDCCSQAKRLDYLGGHFCNLQLF